MKIFIYGRVACGPCPQSMGQTQYRHQKAGDALFHYDHYDLMCLSNHNNTYRYTYTYTHKPINNIDMKKNKHLCFDTKTNATKMSK